MSAWPVLLARVPITKAHFGPSAGWDADITVGNPHAHAHALMRKKPHFLLSSYYIPSPPLASPEVTHLGIISPCSLTSCPAPQWRCAGAKTPDCQACSASSSTGSGGGGSPPWGGARPRRSSTPSSPSPFSVGPQTHLSSGPLLRLPILPSASIPSHFWRFPPPGAEGEGALPRDVFEATSQLLALRPPGQISPGRGKDYAALLASFFQRWALFDWSIHGCSVVCGGAADVQRLACWRQDADDVMWVEDPADGSYNVAMHVTPAALANIRAEMCRGFVLLREACSLSLVMESPTVEAGGSKRRGKGVKRTVLADGGQAAASVCDRSMTCWDN